MEEAASEADAVHATAVGQPGCVAAVKAVEEAGMSTEK